MDDFDLGSTTCTQCGQAFAYADMLPPSADAGQNNTQVHWLMGGRCPHCEHPVEVSMTDLQQRIRAARQE